MAAISTSGSDGAIHGINVTPLVDIMLVLLIIFMVAGRLESLVLDPVYSAKGMAGLIALIEAGRWSRDDDVVFIHTGGEPALFAYLDVLGI